MGRTIAGPQTLPGANSAPSGSQGQRTTSLPVEIGSPVSGQLAVGHVVLSLLNINPADSLGYGTWQRIGKGEYVVGVDDVTPGSPFAVAGSVAGGSLTTSDGSNSKRTVAAGASYDVSGFDHTHIYRPPSYALYMFVRVA